MQSFHQLICEWPAFIPRRKQQLWRPRPPSPERISSLGRPSHFTRQMSTSPYITAIFYFNIISNFKSIVLSLLFLSQESSQQKKSNSEFLEKGTQSKLLLPHSAELQHTVGTQVKIVSVLTTQCKFL